MHVSLLSKHFKKQCKAHTLSVWLENNKLKHSQPLWVIVVIQFYSCAPSVGVSKPFNCKMINLKLHVHEVLITKILKILGELQEIVWKETTIIISENAWKWDHMTMPLWKLHFKIAQKCSPPKNKKVTWKQ